MSTEQADIVCVIELETKTGEKYEIPLARRDDPVAALDKFFQMRTIPRADLSALHCRAKLSAAITFRACEAVTATLQALI